jgi:hypothetical protein
MFAGMVAVVGTGLPAQEKADDAKARAEAAAKSAEPSAAHKQMAKRVGEYTTKTKMWMTPNSPPQETTGTSKITPILGGRFLHEESSGTMMGQPYTSIKIEGFNNATGKYESTWIYTMGTGQMNMAGTSKDGGKTIEYVGSYEGPGGAKPTMNITTRIVNDDQFVVELAGKNPDGSPGGKMEMTYTRKK